jgi:putative hydrolases of HD superfamily
MSDGRQESVAEHCWRMAIMAMLFEKYFPDVNTKRVIEMSLIHDIGEVYDGDVPAFLKKENHLEDERRAVKMVSELLEVDMREKVMKLWEEFEECKTEEAKLVKAIDKLEVLIQHNEADIATWIPEEYELNLSHGKIYNQYNDFIKQFRNTVDSQTKTKIKEYKS